MFNHSTNRDISFIETLNVPRYMHVPIRCSVFAKHSANREIGFVEKDVKAVIVSTSQDFHMFIPTQGIVTRVILLFSNIIIITILLTITIATK